MPCSCLELTHSSVSLYFVRHLLHLKRMEARNKGSVSVELIIFLGVSGPEPEKCRIK